MTSRVISVLALFAVLLAPLGCLTWRGARLYQSGTDALDRGDVAIATRDLEQAAELLPRRSEIQNHLGLAYATEGRWPDAVAAFERAVDLDCENEAAQENLAASRTRLAHWERAEGNAGESTEP